MSEEIKQLIDYLQEFVNDDRKEITKYGVEISQDDTKLLLNYVEQLQQENQHLKQWDKNKDSRNSRQRVANAKLIKKNKELKQQNDLIGKVLDEQLYLQYQDNVLIEFEKWLEERLDMTCGADYNIYTNCLDKLQELKEGKK